MADRDLIGSAPVIAVSIPNTLVSHMDGERAATKAVADKVHDCIVCALGIVPERDPLLRSERFQFCIGSVQVMILIMPLDRLDDCTQWQLHFLTSPGPARMSSIERHMLQQVHLDIADGLSSAPEAKMVEIVRYH